MRPSLQLELRPLWASKALATMLATLLWMSAPAGSQSPPPVQPTAGPDAEQTAIEEAGWLERLSFNTRERTQRGLGALDDERPQDALEPFRSAGRLAPTDALVQYNAGTAELTALETVQTPQPGADAQRSLPSLSYAAENSTEELAPLAHYNLGNAHLSLNDPASALEAFKDSLRADPTNPDAKVNLEIALRELEKQKQEKEQQQQSEEPSDKNEEQDEDQNQQQEPGDEPPPEPPDDQDEQEQSPDFEEQPDMSAEQAAAILEAVENLEREQRRLEAAEKARKGSKQGKDW